MNIKDIVNERVNRIRDWYENESGGSEGLILGISGGKDSSVVAALCSKAIGKDNVLGVIMPNGVQKDIDYAYGICDFLGIKRIKFNISNVYDSLYGDLKSLNNYNKSSDITITEDAKVNIPPRIRMTVLYAIGQSIRYRVVGTGNASERFVGYFTKWGDGACDFNPIARFTSEEVIEIGRELGIPEKFLIKPPADGLCGKTDEDNLGFTYKELNSFIKNGHCGSKEIENKIMSMHRRNLHKLLDIPT